MSDARTEVPRGIDRVASRPAQAEADGEDEQSHGKRANGSQTEGGFRRSAVEAQARRGHRQNREHQDKSANHLREQIRAGAADCRSGAKRGKLPGLVLSYGIVVLVEEVDCHRPNNRPEHLSDDVARHVRPGKLARGGQPDRHGRVDMGAADIADTEHRDEYRHPPAEGDDDPMARYLAINMYPYDWNDYASQLAALRPLAKEFDDKFVAAHITPMIEDYEKMSIVVQNDAALIPGQKVPEFALANYDGNEVELYDLLGEKDLVLIDFWASWCGPCIADFPELKKLHAAYTDEDFEIVGVSIDSTMEDWIGGVDEHVLPWINLGEVKGWEGPVSTMYGVNAIPKGFLVDSQGCIYKKNIRPAALKDFLVDRYGMDESLVEPEAETEDTPDVSS